MALVGNGVRLANANPMRALYGAGNFAANRANFGAPGAARNWYAGAGTMSGGVSIANKSAIPDGYRPPACWLMPPKQGGMASRFEIEGVGAVESANLAGGLYAEATIAGSGSITNAAATLLIYASATLAGTGSLTADIAGQLELAATLAGTGDLTGSLNAVLSASATLAGAGALTADIAGVLAASATLVGIGALTADISGALSAEATIAGTSTLTAPIVGVWDMGATIAGTSTLVAAIESLGHLTATLTGSGAVATADLRALGHIAATIDVSAGGETLTSAGIAAAVWNSLVASFQAPGTMGEALGTAGSGGLSPTQATQLLEIYRLLGLDPTKPLIVTKGAGTTVTDVDAGAEIHQDVVETSTETTVTRS